MTIDKRIVGMKPHQLTLKVVREMLTEAELGEGRYEEITKRKSAEWGVSSIAQIEELTEHLRELDKVDVEYTSVYFTWEEVECREIAPEKYYQQLWKDQLTNKNKEEQERKEYERLKKKYG